MRVTKYVLIASCFCSVISAGVVVGVQNDQTPVEVSPVAIIIENAAKTFGYELIRGYRPTDEWETEEKKSWLNNHAYYTLFGKDSDDSCLSTKGRIGVTVLLFKDADTARRPIAQRQVYHQGNMGFSIIRSNEDGFLLKEVNGFYAAVIRGSQLVFLEDRSRAQRRVIESVADTLTKELIVANPKPSMVIESNVIQAQNKTIAEREPESDEVLLSKAKEVPGTCEEVAIEVARYKGTWTEWGIANKEGDPYSSTRNRSPGGESFWEGVTVYRSKSRFTKSVRQILQDSTGLAYRTVLLDEKGQEIGQRLVKETRVDGKTTLVQIFRITDRVVQGIGAPFLKLALTVEKANFTCPAEAERRQKSQ